MNFANVAMTCGGINLTPGGEVLVVLEGDGAIVFADSSANGRKL